MAAEKKGRRSEEKKPDFRAIAATPPTFLAWQCERGVVGTATISYFPSAVPSIAISDCFLA